MFPGRTVDNKNCEIVCGDPSCGSLAIASYTCKDKCYGSWNFNKSFQS